MRPTRTSLAALVLAALLTGAGQQPTAGVTSWQTLTGTVRILVVDTPGTAAGGDRGPAGSTAQREDTGRHTTRLRTRAVADVGDRLLDLPEAQSATLQAGDTVTVTTRGGSVAASVVERTAGRSEGRLTAAARPTVVGDHTLTVLPVYWTAPDTSLSTLTTLATETALYWSEQSGGRISVVPTVRDWVRIPDPGSCGYSALANAALDAHDVPLPDAMPQHVLIYFPHWEDCGWAGLGQVGGPLIWDNGYPLIDVTAHEFGHNLGLGHANTAACLSEGSRVTLSSSCSVAEYRDYADVMGIAMDTPSGNLNTSLADSIGLARTVTAAAGSRTSVDLAPLAQVDAVRAVKIPVPTGWVYVDYRPATGRDVRMPRWAGVQAHLLPDDDLPASQLLDGQPATAFAAVSLPPGTTWTVPDSGLTVTVTSVGASKAHVEVAPAVGGSTPPTPIIRAPANGSVVGSSTTLSWRVPSAVASLRLAVDGRTVSTTAVRSLSGTLQVTGLRHGRHVLTLRAADESDQLSAPSAPLTLVADLAAPSIPARLKLSSRQVLSWRASTDAGSGVAGYLVSLDGRARARLTRTSTSTRTPVGRHTWWVAAVDRVGNVSPASGLVVVRSTRTSTSRSTRVQVVSRTTRGQRTLVTGRTVGTSRPL